MKGELLSAIKSGDADQVWALCSEGYYSDAAYENPLTIWDEVKACINFANDEMIGAISSCLVEHMLGFEFNILASDIEIELQSENVNMANCISTISKFGESRKAENQNRFHKLKDLAISIYSKKS